MKRWTERVWRLFVEMDVISDDNDGSLDHVYHATVEKVTRDLEHFGFNTAISQLMIFINEAYKVGKIPMEYAIGFVKMFAVYAPHMGEELWRELGQSDELSFTSWPTYDERKLVLDEVEIVVQINGKIRAKFSAPSDVDEKTILGLAYEQENVIRNLEGFKVVKEIVIKNKIVNLVIKPN